MTNNPRTRFILLATAGYCILAMAWIFLSDRLLSIFTDLDSVVWLSTAKGVFFVIATTGLFFLALHAVPAPDSVSGRASLLGSFADSMATVRRRWPMYVFAVASTLAMLVVRESIAASVNNDPMLILFMLPIILSALLGRLGPGLTATAVAGLGTDYWALSPIHSLLIINSQDLLQWCFLMINGIAVSMLSEVLNRTLLEVQNNRRLLDTVVSGTTDAIFVKDKFGSYLIANKATADYVGKALEDIIGNDDHVLFPKSSAEQLRANDRAIMSSSRTQTLEENLTTHDGKHLTFLVTKGPMFDDAGHVIGLFGVSRDITHNKQVEEEIRTGRAKLEAALASMSDAVFISDNQGRFVHFNEAFAAFHKFNCKADCATTFADYPLLFETSSVDGELLPPEQWAIPRALRGESATDAEFVIRRKDSGESWIGSYNFAPIRDQEGMIVGAVVTARDITERKQTEQALQRVTQELEDRVVERTQEYFDLYHQAPCGYHSLALDGTILRVNQTELALLGYSNDEFVGHHISEFVAPDCMDRFKVYFPEFIRTGRLRDLEMNFLCKDGSIRPFLVSAELIRNAQGQGLYSTSTMMDNSERKARDQKLLDLNKFLSEVLEVLPFGVVVYDEERKAVLRNSLFGKLLNYPAELSQKEPLFFADSVRFNFERGDYPNRSFDEALAEFINIIESQQTVCFERKQANGAFLEIRGQPISNGWTLLTYTDITQHRLTEQSLEAARQVAEAATIAKSAFLANMSHEIRTPMNVILGLAYLLEQTELPGDANALVRKIRIASRSLLGIINDILDFSKIESGKLDIERAAFQLGDVLENLATIMSANAGEKELELIIAPPPSKTSQLLGDALRLEQVLINLTSNAIKFTERGHVALSITVVAEDDQQVSLRFAVRDTGMGIPLKMQQEIFAPFAQADGSTSRRFGGTGLGLTISRRLVAYMGGELHVSSVPGSGSEFWFVLSFERTADVWLASPKLPNLPILIVDDNPIAREVLSNMVCELGWDMTTVSSGEAVISHLQTRVAKGDSEAVLLLDYTMPGMDGLATAGKIRNELKDLKNPIILMVTTYSSMQLQGHPHLDWVDAMLTKPVTPAALQDAVARAFYVRQGVEVQIPTASRQRLTGLRVLVVDDSDINREVAERILIGEGAQVFLANDGRQAVDWLETHPNQVDIVLMDVQMPVLNGYEATRLIRSVPALAELPVVALSAGAFMEQQELAQEAGMTSFIAKPFDVDAAIALIIKLTRHKIKPSSTKDTTFAASSQDVEQDLPGLLISKGLRLCNSKSAYQDLLRRFVRDYADCVKIIAGSERVEAQAQLHKLKGVAGVLALETLADKARALEEVFAQQQDPKASLEALQLALDLTLRSIEQYAPIHDQVESTLSDVVDPTVLKPLLYRMLNAFDSDSTAMIRPVFAELSTVLPASRLADLSSAIENFDFRGGEAATQKIIDDYYCSSKET